jgi:hypothetical protein
LVAGLAGTVLGRGGGHGEHPGHRTGGVSGEILIAALGIAPARGGFQHCQQRARRRLPAPRPKPGQRLLDDRGEQRRQPTPLGGQRIARGGLEQRRGLWRNPQRLCPFARQIRKRRRGHGGKPGARGGSGGDGLFLRRAHRLQQRVRVRFQNGGEQRGFVRIGAAEARRRKLHLPGEARERGGRHPARGEQGKRGLAHLFLPRGPRLGEPVLAECGEIGRAVMDQVVVAFPGGFRLAAGFDQRGRSISRRRRLLRQHRRRLSF